SRRNTRCYRGGVQTCALPILAWLKIDATYYLNHAIIVAETEESNHSHSRDRHTRGRSGKRSIASKAALTVHNPTLVQQRRTLRRSEERRVENDRPRKYAINEV